MKILIASDSFKGSLSSFEVGKAAKRGILKYDPHIDVDIAGIGDGGDGSMDVIKHSLPDTKSIEFNTLDLLGRPIQSEYLMTTFKNKPMAIIETANTVGIDLIEPSPKTFEKATSFPVGSQIRDAIQKGARKIIVLTGGTGVSDGGLGLLQALGVNFYDQDDHLIGREKNLLCTEFSRIDGLKEVMRQLYNIQIVLASDVDNPYSGKNGSQVIYGPQKGGTKVQIQAHDRHLQSFEKMIEPYVLKDVGSIPGAGAAGGIGGVLLALGALCESGFDVIAEMTGLEEKVSRADLIITGEGRLDLQTHHGKAPFRVIQMAHEMHKPVVLIAGRLSPDLRSLDKLNVPYFSIQRGPSSAKHAMDKRFASDNISSLVNNLIKFYRA